jgi:putative ABC transport system permease protein
MVENGPPWEPWERCYRRLLVLFPPSFRRTHEEEMVALFRELGRDARARGRIETLLFLTRAALDLCVSALKARRNTRIRIPRRTSSMTTWKHDAAVALRLLSKSPAFTLFATMTMSLGIGANTAIFSAVYGVLLRPIGLADPGSIAVARLHREANEGDVSGFHPRYLEDLERILDSSQTVQKIASCLYESVTLARDGGEREAKDALMVSTDFFEVMGVSALRGRTFRPEDEILRRRGRVAVIAESFWNGRLGGDPGVVGSTLVLDDEPVEVVGVVPARLPLPDADTELWIPQSWDPDDVTLLGRVMAIVRLSREEALDDARVLFAAAAESLQKDYPRFEGYTISLKPFHETIVGSARPALVLASVAVGLLLLIACSNTASLLLSRAAVRAREMATRRALGAGRPQIASQLLAESLALALPSCLAGIGLAFGLHRALLALASSYLPRVHEVRLDLPILAFAVAISILSAVLFGLAPVFYTFSLNLAQQMGGGASSGGGLGRSVPWQSRALVVSQLALAASLLLAATLMARSLLNLHTVNPGFRIQGIEAARVYLDDRAYGDDEAQEAYFRALVERLDARADVESAGATSGLPLDPITIDFDLPYTLPGEEPSTREVKQAFFRTITPGYLETMGIPLLAGRPFDSGDRAGGRPVALVNETFARLAWPDRDPVGERFSIYSGKLELNIVGVVGDVRFGSPASPPKPEFYVPHPQASYSAMTVAVRAAGTGSASAAVAEEALALDPRQPIHSRFTLESLASAAVSTERFLTVLLIAFAAAALCLASSGIYAVVSYWVNESRREIGLRIALGAGRGSIVVRVLRRGLSMTALGFLFGLAGSFFVTRFLGHFLFGVGAGDTTSLVLVVSALSLTAFAASFVPALRASGLDPVRSLRAE